MKAVFRAFGEAVRIGRENREVFHRAIRRYMREDNPKLIDKFYDAHYYFAPKPRNMYPLESGARSGHQRYASDGGGAARPARRGFYRATALREVEKEGFFAWAKN